jgi:hypothetical protein
MENQAGSGILAGRTRQELGFNKQNEAWIKDSDKQNQAGIWDSLGRIWRESGIFICRTRQDSRILICRTLQESEILAYTIRQDLRFSLQNQKGTGIRIQILTVSSTSHRNRDSYAGSETLIHCSEPGWRDPRTVTHEKVRCMTSGGGILSGLLK